MTTTTIYKAGVPSVAGTAVKGTLGTQGPATGTASYTSVGTVSAQTGTATYRGANSDNGTVVTKAMAKNTPQS